jgi:hypothetical protein
MAKARGDCGGQYDCWSASGAMTKTINPPTIQPKNFQRKGTVRLNICVSALRYRRSKDIRILPIVIAELKFRNVQQHVFTADLVECADHTALEDRPEALNRVRVNRADNIFVRGVIDDFMLRESLVEVFVADPMVNSAR